MDMFTKRSLLILFCVFVGSYSASSGIFDQMTDTDPPVVTTTSFDTDTLFLNLSEQVVLTAGSEADFLLTDCKGETLTPTVVMLDSNSEQVKLTFSGLDQLANLVTLAYTNSSNRITDIAGNALWTFSSSLNKSTQIFNVSFAEYAGTTETFDPTNEEAEPWVFQFNDTGSKLFVTGSASDSIHEYDLSVTFDVSTAIYAGAAESFYVGNEEGNPRALAFSQDGLKMFLAGLFSDRIHAYTLTSPFDVSTAVYDNVNISGSGEFIISDITFSNDGLKLFIVGSAKDAAMEFIMTSPYDISTASYTGSAQDYSFQNIDDDVSALLFNSDGSKMYFAGVKDDAIYSYNLGTPFDVSTAVNLGSQTLYVGGRDNAPRSIAFDAAGEKLFVMGSETNKIHEYILDPADEPLITNVQRLSTDTLKLSFDRPVTVNASIAPTDFQILDGDGTGFLVNDIITKLDEQSEVYLVTANLSTALSYVEISYTNNGGIYSSNCLDLQGLASPLRLSFETIPPQVVAFDRVSDTSIKLTFDENVQINNINFGDFTFQDCFGNTFQITGISQFLTGTKEVTFIAEDFSNRKGGLSIAFTKSTTNISDQFGNQLATFSGLSTSNVFDINAQFGFSTSFATYESVMRSFHFDPTGTKLYILGTQQDKIQTFTLSNPFDVNTSTLDPSGDFGYASEDLNMLDMDFNADGSKLFLLAPASQSIFEYTLSVNYDVSTATYAGAAESLSLNNNGETFPTTMLFDDTGMKLYVIGTIIDAFQLYNLTSPYDVSTGVVSSTPILDVSSNESNPTTASFNSTGSQLVVAGTNGQQLLNYELSTPYDMSTATFIGGRSVSGPRNLYLDATTGNFFVLASNNTIGTYQVNDVFEPQMSSILINSTVPNSIILQFNEEVFGDSLLAVNDFTVTDALSNSFNIESIAFNKAVKQRVFFILEDFASAVGSLNITYANSNGAIVDENCNELETDITGASLKLDGTNPELLTIRQESNTELTLFFSELVQTNETNPTDFTVTDGIGNNYPVSAQFDDVAQDNIIKLTVANLGSATDTVRVSYTNNNGEIFDFADNLLATIDATDAVKVDNIDPTLAFAIKASDTVYTVGFSESIVPKESFFDDFEMKDGAGNTYAISKMNDNNLLDRRISIEVASTSEAIGDITITYTNNNDAIVDLIGLTLKTDAVGVTIDTDQSSPEIAGIRKESNTELTLFFNEPVQVALNTFSDFTVTDGQGNSYAVTDIADGTALDNQVVITTASTATAVDLIVAYANNNDAIKDFGGNSLQSVSDLILDTVSPVLFSAYVLPSRKSVRVHFGEAILGNPAISDFVLSNCQGDAIAVSSIVKVNDAIWDLNADSTEIVSSPNINIQFNGSGTVTDIVGNVALASTIATEVSFDPAKADFENLSLTVSNNNNAGLQFNDDGTKLFVTSVNNSTILAYNLSIAHDLSSATIISNEILNSSGVSNVLSSFFFADDGSKLFATGVIGGLFSYDLASPYTLTGATYNGDAITIGGYMILVSNDGMHMVLNVSLSRYDYYTFGVPYDLSTITLVSQLSLANSSGAAWSATGDRFFTINRINRELSQYSLQEPFSLKGAELMVEDQPNTFGVGGNPYAITFNQAGDKLLVASNGDEIYSYSIDIDATAPILQSAAKTTDTAIKLTFNEDIITRNTNPADVSVKDGIGTSYLVTAIGDVVPSDAELELTVADFSGAIGDLQITYVGDNEEIADLSCNPLATDAVGVGIDLDQVSPTIVSAAKISQAEVEVTLSEPVQLTGNTTQSFEIRDALNTVLTINSVSDDIANDRKIILTISSLDQAVGDAMLSKTYDAANPQVQDFGGNDLQAEPLGVSIDLDQTAPAMESLVKISDTEVEVNFSEIVAINGTQFIDFVLTDNLGTTFAISNIAIISNGKLSLTTASLASVDNEITLTYINSTGLISDLGNNELATDNVGVSLDIVAPAKPAILSMADDLGFSTSDLLTNDTDLVISGTAEINSTVTIYLGGTLVGTTMADTNGEFSYQTGVLTYGDYILTATATDPTGNVGELSDSFSFTVKTSSPSVSTISRTTTNPFITTELTFSVSFTEGVSGVSLDDFDLAFTGTLTPSMTALDSLSPTDYTVSVENLIETQSGDLTLSLVDDNSIFGIAGNLLGGSSIGDGDFTGETYESRAAQTITFSPIADKTYSNTAIDLEASASSGLSVTYTVTGPAERSGTQLTTTGVGLVTVTADQSGDGSFVPALAESQSFNVGQATLVATADDQTITFGDALPALTLSYSGFVGSDVASDLDALPTLSTTAKAGDDAGTYPITVVGGSDVNYEFDNQAGTLTINRADQVVTFTQANDIDLLTDNSVVLSATSSIGLTITYSITQGSAIASLSGSKINVTGSGTVTVEALQAGNVNYNPASASMTFNVTDSRKTDQTITFTDDLSGLTYGDAGINLSATSSSSLSVTYSVTGPVSIDGSTLVITGAGDATVTATQTGDGTFNPANPVTNSFTIDRADLVATPEDDEITFGGSIPNFTASYSGFIGSDAVSDLDVLPTLSTTATTASDAGTYPITASGGLDDNYSFNYQSGTLTINKADQQITFPQVSDIDLLTDNSVALNASSSIGLAVTYNITQGTSIASLNGSTVTVTGSGTVTVEALQVGNTNYNSASASMTFDVADSRKTDQTITFEDDLTGLTYGDSDITLSATASSNLDVVYVTTGAVSIDGNTLSILGAGDATVTAIQTGNSDFNPATSVTLSFTITKAELMVNAEDASMTYGDASLPSLGFDYSGFVGLDDSSDLDVAPTTSTVALVTSDVGTYPITTSGGLDDNYSFNYQSGTLTINKADQQITFPQVSDIDLLTDNSVALNATSSIGLAVTYNITQGTSIASLSGSTVTVTGSGTVTVEAHQAGNTNYNPASASMTFNVADSRKTDQTITFEDDLTGLTYGDSDITLSATASSNLDVVYVTTGAVSIDGNTLSLLGAGDATVTATQTGNGDFNPATSVTQSFTITKAELMVNAEDASMTYGAASLPSLGFDYSGFVGLDDSADLDVAPTASTVALVTSDAGTYPITASGGLDDNYSFNYQSGTLTINKADQQITFPQVSDVDLLTDNSVALNATSSIGLAVTYNITQGTSIASLSGSTVTVTGSGTVTVEALQAGNTNYNSASASMTFNVTDSRKTDQTITFEDDLVGLAYGDSDITLSATASSNLDIVYVTTGAVSIDGNTLSVLGAGDATVTATQTGNGDFNPASSVTQSFTITKAELMVNAEDASMTYGAASLPSLGFDYSGFVGLDDSSDLDIEPTASTVALVTSDAGTYPITASGGLDDNYTFNYQSGTLTIDKADQMITFDQVSSVDISQTTTVALVAQSTSGLAISYELITGDGQISGNTLTLNNTGNFTVEASQSGNTNYNPASEVTVTFDVRDTRKTDQTITFSQIADGAYGDVITLNATASSDLAVTYELVTGSGSIINGELTITGVGAYTVRATQSGDATFNTAGAVEVSFTVIKTKLTVTAGDQIINAGEAIPVLGLTYDGFKLGEDISVLDVLPTASTAATGTSPAGDYPIVVSGGSDDFYDFTFVEGVLTISEVLNVDKPEVQIYPNPVASYLSIRGLQYLEAKIFDLDGKLLLVSPRTDQIDISTIISSGVFLLNLYDQKGQVIHKHRIIKK